MSSKIMPLFIASVLLASFVIVVIPQASALIASTGDRDRTPVTARFEGAKRVCGDHLCLPGERTSWEKAVWDTQKTSQDKISSIEQHGEDVMHQMAGSTPGSTTLHGSQKPTMHSIMPVIGASQNANMTGNVPTYK